jgi:HEAT repeat protein
MSRIAEIVTAVLQSPIPEHQRVNGTIVLLGETGDPVAIVALRSYLTSANAMLRLEAAAALIRNNDMSGMPIAESVFLGDRSGLPETSVSNLRASLRQIQDPNAVPSLARLLSQADVETRRVVASAVRQMRSAEAMRLLIRAMEDPDVDVQWEAVMGLAQATGQLQWGPSIPAYHDNPSYYREYWRAWARNRQ